MDWLILCLVILVAFAVGRVASWYGLILPAIVLVVAFYTEGPKPGDDIPTQGIAFLLCTGLAVGVAAGALVRASRREN